MIEAELALVRPDVEIEWLFFANDLQTANSNCIKDTKKQRDVAGNLAGNQAWTRDYDIPAGVAPIPIHPL